MASTSMAAVGSRSTSILSFSLDNRVLLKEPSIDSSTHQSLLPYLLFLPWTWEDQKVQYIVGRFWRRMHACLRVMLILYYMLAHADAWES